MFRLVRQRPLLIFAGCVLLLQLANAAMLPLMAGVVTTRSSQWAPVLIAVCIVVPQAIVALMSPTVGAKAQAWGRRPLLLIGFGALADPRPVVCDGAAIPIFWSRCRCSTASPRRYSA